MEFLSIPNGQKVFPETGFLQMVRFLVSAEYPASDLGTSRQYHDTVILSTEGMRVLSNLRFVPASIKIYKIKLSCFICGSHSQGKT